MKEYFPYMSFNSILKFSESSKMACEYSLVCILCMALVNMQFKQGPTNVSTAKAAPDV